MATITILPEGVGTDDVIYRAISGPRHSEGKTAGEALDALAAQLNEEEAGTLVIVQNLHPDRFFTAQQKERLGELMTRWRSARDANDVLPAAEQAELEELIEAELNAAADRAHGASQELNQQVEVGSAVKSPLASALKEADRLAILDAVKAVHTDATKMSDQRRERGGRTVKHELVDSDAADKEA